MKKLGGLIILLGTLLAVPAGQAQAACANVSSFGAVTLKVPELRQLEGQVLWVRLQAPSETVRILAEVNESDCLEAGGAVTPDAWQWHASREGATVKRLVFPKAVGNTIRLIGVQDGVKVDRVLLAEPDCTPQDFGDNCSQSVELTPDTTDVTALPPLREPVSGKVELSPTPVLHQAELRELIYRIDNQLLQQSQAPASFDTTLAANGKHTVAIEIVLQDGRRIHETIVIEIENQENFLSPVTRFMRLNRGVLIRVAAAAACLLLIAGLAWLYRHRRRARRERRFRGF